MSHIVSDSFHNGNNMYRYSFRCIYTITMGRKLDSSITDQIYPLRQEGYSIDQIAKKLNISAPTVRNHLYPLVNKVVIEVPAVGTVDNLTNELFKLRAELLKHLRYTRVRLLKAMESEADAPLGVLAMASRAVSGVATCENVVSGIRLLDLNLAVKIVEDAGYRVVEDPKYATGD